MTKIDGYDFVSVFKYVVLFKIVLWGLLFIPAAGAFNHYFFWVLTILMYIFNSFLMVATMNNNSISDANKLISTMVFTLAFFISETATAFLAGIVIALLFV